MIYLTLKDSLNSTRRGIHIEKILLDNTNPMDYILPMTSDDLKKWRKRNGYSQGKLAKALGVISFTVSRWERGVRAIPSFLHLALECLEIKGGGEKLKGQKKRKEVKENG